LATIGVSSQVGGQGQQEALIITSSSDHQVDNIARS
jgi:hypothetical protein